MEEYLYFIPMLLGYTLIGYLIYRFFIYPRKNAIVEQFIVVDLDQAGITTSFSNYNVGVSSNFSVGSGRTRKSGFAIVALKNKMGQLVEFAVPGKYLSISEVRIGDVCYVKYYKNKVYGFQIDRTYRYH